MFITVTFIIYNIANFLYYFPLVIVWFKIKANYKNSSEYMIYRSPVSKVQSFDINMIFVCIYNTLRYRFKAESQSFLTFKMQCRSILWNLNNQDFVLVNVNTLPSIWISELTNVLLLLFWYLCKQNVCI